MVGKENIFSTLQEQRNKLINNLFAHCNSLVKAEKLSELTKWHRKIILINPSDPELYFRIAEDFRVQGLYEPAIEYYGEALKLNNQYAQAYYGRAGCYFRLDEKILALPDAEKAIFYGKDDALFLKKAKDLHADITQNLTYSDIMYANENDSSSYGYTL